MSAATYVTNYISHGREASPPGHDPDDTDKVGINAEPAGAVLGPDSGLALAMPF